VGNVGDPFQERERLATKLQALVWAEGGDGYTAGEVPERGWREPTYFWCVFGQGVVKDRIPPVCPWIN